MTQVYVCEDCKKIYKTNGKEPCEECGCTNFQIKNVADKKSEVKAVKVNNLERKNITHVKIEFYTTTKSKKVHNELMEIINNLEEKIMIESFCKINGK